FLPSIDHRHHLHPELIIGVGGCMVQRQREALFDTLPFVDLAWGTSAVHQVVSLLDRVGGTDPVLCVPAAEHDLSRLLVCDEGELVGIVSMSDVDRTRSACASERVA
ncbi:MAG: hypothetical protein ACE5EV_02450, partial [Gaiellales bacterium]